MRTIKILILTICVLFTAALNAENLKANASKSKIEWTGKKVTGEHSGFINLKEGTIDLDGDEIIKANFTIDMTSITNTDLENEQYNAKLVGHLKSDDFFGVENHPTATLTVSIGAAFINGEATITGDLTIKGITNPLTFKVVKDGYKLSSILTIDRSKYNVKYNSGSFFDGLGDKMIYDEFTLDITLVVE